MTHENKTADALAYALNRVDSFNPGVQIGTYAEEAKILAAEVRRLHAELKKCGGKNCSLEAKVLEADVDAWEQSAMPRLISVPELVASLRERVKALEYERDSHAFVRALSVWGPVEYKQESERNTALRKTVESKQEEIGFLRAENAVLQDRLVQYERDQHRLREALERELELCSSGQHVCAKCPDSDKRILKTLALCVQP